MCDKFVNVADTTSNRDVLRALQRALAGIASCGNDGAVIIVDQIAERIFNADDRLLREINTSGGGRRKAVVEWSMPMQSRGSP